MSELHWSAKHPKFKVLIIAHHMTSNVPKKLNAISWSIFRLETSSKK